MHIHFFAQSVLSWHEEWSESVGQSVKLNADCMIHAALEDDRDRLAMLYSFGYRLGTDTDKRINKDYLKRIKLFKARASPVYKSVVFENSHDIYKDDPLKKCFEYARQARINASKIQVRESRVLENRFPERLRIHAGLYQGVHRYCEEVRGVRQGPLGQVHHKA